MLFDVSRHSFSFFRRLVCSDYVWFSTNLISPFYFSLICLGLRTAYEKITIALKLLLPLDLVLVLFQKSFQIEKFFQFYHPLVFQFSPNLGFHRLQFLKINPVLEDFSRVCLAFHVIELGLFIYIYIYIYIYINQTY
jgi:hypothetical protein